MAINHDIEKAVTENRVFELANALTKIQKSVIGVFRLHAVQYFEMVVEKTDFTVRTVRIGNFMGLQDSHYAIEAGEFVPLPDHYDNLHELLQRPFEFAKWSNSLV